MPAQKLTENTIGHKAGDFGDLEAVFEEAAKRAKDGEKAEKKGKKNREMESDEEELARLRAEVEKKKRKAGPSRGSSQTPPKEGGVEEKKPGVKVESKDNSKNNAEHQKFVAEWQNKIPEIQTFIDDLNSKIDKIKRPEDHEDFIWYLRMYEKGLKRIINRCSNEQHILLPQDTDNWKRYSQKKGMMYSYRKELLSLIESQKKVDEPTPEKKAVESEVVPPVLNEQEKFIKEWEKKIPAVEDVILRLDAIIPQRHLIDASDNQEAIWEELALLKQVFIKIASKYNGVVSAEIVTEEDEKKWSDFIKPGNRLYLTMQAFEKELEELQKPKAEAVPPIEPKEEEIKTVPTMPDPELIVRKPEPEVLPTPALTLSPLIEEKLATTGLTLENLATIPEFADIADSEGKIFWMLERFKQVKLRRIKNDATEEFEKENREIRNRGAFAKKIWRSIRRGSLVEMKAQEHAKRDFDFEKYRQDVEGLVHLASASPDMVLKKKSGETSIVAQYIEGVRGINDEKFSNFNECATAFANIPPKYEWKKVSKKDRAEYERIEKEYLTQRDALLSLIPNQLKTVVAGIKGDIKTDFYSQADALNILSNADFSVKMHQSINSHPTAELELKRLAETNGWNRKWDIAKAQLGIAGGAGIMGTTFGFVAGTSALRWSARSAVVMTCVTASAPLVLAGTAIGMGWWIGGMRGKMRGEQQLKKEEELMRMGFEEQTGASKLLPRINVLFKNRTEINEKIREEENKGVGKNSRKINKLKERLLADEDEIAKLKAKQTDLNFVKAEALTDKIEHLRDLISMDYPEYVEYVKGKGDGSADARVSFEGFDEKKKDWAEQLETRLEYVRKKLGDGKISFGKEDDGKALATRFNLLQSIGDATADLAVTTHHDTAKVFIGVDSGKKYTRKDRMLSALGYAEGIIQSNRENFVQKQKSMGRILGVSFAGIGFGAGRLFHEYINTKDFIKGSDIAEVVQKRAEVIRGEDFKGSKELSSTFKEAVKASVSHSEMQQLNQETIPTTPEVPERAFHYDPTDLNGNPYNLPLTDKPIPSFVPGGSIPDSIPLNPISTPESFGKPFEVSLTNEAQSREYALKQYFIHKGMSSAEAGKKASQTIKDLVKDIPGSKGERSLPFVHKGDKVVIFEKDGKVNLNVVPKGQVVEQLPKVKVEESVVIKDGQQDVFTGKRVGGDSAERAVTRVLRINAQEYGFKGDVENKMEVRKWADGMTKEVLRQNPKMANIVTHNGDKLELVRTPNGKWFAEVERGDVVPNKVVESAPIEFFDKAEPAISLESSGAIPETPVVIPETPEAIPEIKDTAPDLGEEGDLFFNENPVSSTAEAFVSHGVNGVGSFSNAIEKTFASDPRFANLQPRDQDKFLFKALMHVMDTAQKEENIREFFNNMGIKSGNPFNIKDDSIDVSKVFDKPTLDKIYSDIAEGKVSDKVVGFEGRIFNRLAALKKMSPEKLGGEIKKLKAYLWFKGIK